MSSIQQTQAAIKAIHHFLSDAPTYIRAIQHYQINLVTTYEKAQQAYDGVEMFKDDLEQIVQDWSNLTSSSEDMIAELFIRSLVTDLDTAQDTLKQLQSVASDLKTNSTKVGTELSEKLKQLEAELTSAEQQIDQLNTQITETGKSLNKIKDQLSGASGFWEGFKTGISFGAYSGLRNKLSQEKSLQQDYSAKLSQLKSASSTIQSDVQAIKQVQPALSTCDYLYDNLAPLQNTLSELLEQVKETEHDGDKVVSATKMKVADFYAKKLDKKMQDLLAWPKAFSV